VREVVEFLGYASFLLEKIVAQSIEEGENLLSFSKTKNLAVWVNCKNRTYPVHRRLKSLLDPGDPIIFNVAGGNHGLATNGIHMADLFAYYDGAKRVESAGSHIDPVVHPSKRATHIFDLSGALQGITERGSRFTLTYAEDHQGPEIIVITTRRRRYLVDHFSRWAIESDEDTGWSWRAVPFEGNILISQTSQVFVSDILNSGQCSLPTLEESLVAHRFVLNELQPYFRQLLQRDDASCPVT
jgi:predicted dehydrogenase